MRGDSIRFGNGSCPAQNSSELIWLITSWLPIVFFLESQVFHHIYVSASVMSAQTSVFFSFSVVVLAFRRQFCCPSLANHASCFPGSLIKQGCVQLQWNTTAGCITVLAKENSTRWTASEAMFTYPFKWISNGNLKREDQVVKNPDQHYNWNTKLENSLIRRLFTCECLARTRTISMRWRGLNSWLISGRSRYLWAVFTE